MAVLLGPILHLEPGTATTWRFSVHVLTDLPAESAPSLALTCNAPGVKVGALQLVASFPAQRRTVWCFGVEAARSEAERTLTYTLADQRTSQTIDQVAVPARGRLPRIALFSCNGFSSEALMRKAADPNVLWRRLWTEHAAGLSGGHPDNPSGIHVLLGAGDQVYADSLPVLRDLDQLSHRELRRLRSSVDRRDRALREYLALYQQRWSEPEVAKMLARVPGVFTWDDHDVFDGFGSHAAEIQTNPAYLDVFEAARAAFRALQLGGDASGRAPALLQPRGHRPNGHFLQSVTLHGGGEQIEVLLLDSRNDRTPERVLSETQWSDIKTFLGGFQAKNAKPAPRHLLVVAAVPVVHLRFRAVSRILGSWVPWTQEIEDDLLDQWEHPAHLGERARLILTLLQHQPHSGSRVTILSGDVHAGAHGRIESTRQEHRRSSATDVAFIVQLTSSGIVHPSPNGWQRQFLELLGSEGRDEVTSGVTTEMLPLDSSTERLWARNFLLLDVDGAQASVPHQLWARFVADGGAASRLLTVPPWSAV